MGNKCCNQFELSPTEVYINSIFENSHLNDFNLRNLTFEQLYELLSTIEETAEPEENGMNEEKLK